jgi:hypothetical protein
MNLMPILATLVAIAAASALFGAVILPFLLRQLGSHLLRRTVSNRSVIFKKLGVSDHRCIVGFFHPYWCVSVAASHGSKVLTRVPQQRRRRW